jgi:integrase
VWPYKTKAGQVRYAIGYLVVSPDGSQRTVTRRRGPAGEKWTTYLDASKALRDALAEGAHLHPERFSRTFGEALARCGRELAGAGLEPPPVIRLHDLRHTHATLLLSAGKPVKVVSERLGHSSAVVTMTVYAHVLPGGQREAADSFDAMLGEAQA